LLSLQNFWFWNSVLQSAGASREQECSFELEDGSVLVSHYALLAREQPLPPCFSAQL